MAEPVEWRADRHFGCSPYSPRFADRYRSEDGGLAQSTAVFLHGCGLPALWANQPQWCILETGFGLGLNFLVAWQAWLNDAARPGMLHFLSVEAYPVSAADIVQAAQCHPHLLPLAQQLAAQWWGLMPGFHRLVFENGQVLLTLGIGEAKTMLRDQSPGFAADSVFLDDFSPQCNPDIWDVATLKAVARCVRRGTRVATWTVARMVQDNLTQAGFVMHKVPGVAPESDNLQGQYNPPWMVKTRTANGLSAPATTTVQWPAELSRTALIIGAGLAGAAVAASLARRGWQVLVLEAGATAASGASSLPAGVLAPHVSRGDASSLSELSRCGVRATLGQAEALLTSGLDWNCTGVLQRLELDAADADSSDSLAGFYRKGISTAFQTDWSRPATVQEYAAAGLPLPELDPGNNQALFHPRAGWIKPASLVKAWLENANIRLQTHSQVQSFISSGSQWQALDASGQCLGQGHLVVLAAGFDNQALIARTPAKPACALQAIRGQVSWGFLPVDIHADSWPSFPVNGHGSFITGVPMNTNFPIPVGPATAGRHAWLAGASYARDCTDLQESAEDHVQNLKRLRLLLPSTAEALQAIFPATLDAAKAHMLHSWAGIRCVAPNRLPLVGPLENPSESAPAQWWVCTAMGSRGLTMAALCAELLAARLHGEPLATGRKLADALTHFK